MRSSATRLTAGSGQSAVDGGRPAVTVVPPRRVMRYAKSSARIDPANSNANSTPPELSARICSTRVVLAGVDRVRGAEAQRLLQLVVGQVDGDDLRARPPHARR